MVRGNDRSVEAHFLNGPFIRAGDLEAPPTGGTVAALERRLLRGLHAGLLHARSAYR